MNFLNKVISLFKSKPKQPKFVPIIGDVYFSHGEYSSFDNYTPTHADDGAVIAFSGTTDNYIDYSGANIQVGNETDLETYINNRNGALKNFKKPAIGKKEIQTKSIADQKEIEWVKGIIRVVKQSKSNG